MMNFFRPRQTQDSASADNGRRSFFWKMGAAVSTAFASTAGMARPQSGDAQDLSLKVALLEEEKALRKLHQAFEQAMNKGLYEEVTGMFAEDAQVVFNGGIFDNRNHGVSRLFRRRFQSGRTGKTTEPAPGFELDADQQQDSVEVAADRLSAKAVFPYSIQVGVPIQSETSLAGMARLHGEGIRTWWEGGVYNVTYRKDVVDGCWKISSLEYNTLSRADYRPGRTCARPISVSPIARRYPEDQQGPDALV